MDDVGRGPVALDTVAFIYFIEEHPAYLPIVEPVFQAIDTGHCKGVTSGVTLLEVLVVPYRAGNLDLANRYEALLTRSRHLRLIEPTRDQLRAAAHVRAVHRVRTPDALQLAAALVGGCSVFVTNDRDLPSVTGLRVLQLNRYLERS